MKKPLSFLLLFWIFIQGCIYADSLEKVPLPEICEPVSLRVVYAHNPRFRQLDQAELTQILAYATQEAKKQLGVTVTFTLLPSIPISTLFTYLKPAVKKARKQEIYDFKRGSGDRTRLINAFMEGLKERYTPLKDLVTYASPYLVHQPVKMTEHAFASALTDTLLERIKSWQTLKAPDRQPVIDESEYNEWTYWDSLGYGTLPYDIVITNTLIASVEYYGQDIHSALRGGVTVGTTTNNNSKLGAYVFWSTFPFMENYPLLAKMRDDDYTQKDALRLCGTYLVHEIGHLLFHYGHPFESDSCIMSPVPMLKFKTWADKLDPEKCRQGRYPAMEKGAAMIYYNPAWK